MTVALVAAVVVVSFAAGALFVAAVIQAVGEQSEEKRR